MALNSVGSDWGLTPFYRGGGAGRRGIRGWDRWLASRAFMASVVVCESSTLMHQPPKGKGVNEAVSYIFIGREREAACRGKAGSGTAALRPRGRRRRFGASE
jgi:hypothetical protein